MRPAQSPADLLAQTDLDLPSLARALTAAFDADGTLILTVDSGEGELKVAVADPAHGTAEAALRLRVGHGVIGLVASNGRAVLLDEDSPRNQAHRQLMSLQPGQVVTRMCVPSLGVDGAVVAVVSVHRHRSLPFAAADLEVAQPLANLLGVRLHAQQLLAESRSHRTEKDRLIAQAVSAQEDERRRIAGDLHDGVTQALVSLAFHLSAGDASLAAADASADDRADDRSAPVADAQTQIRAARRLAELAYDETRAAISGLHSMILDDLGLVSALESLAQSVPQLDVEFRAEDVGDLANLPDHCAATLYRIAQEALNNAVKHAEAARAVLSLRRVGELVVLGVTDDGIGFDVSAAGSGQTDGPGGHFGLRSLEERCALVGANLRIDSTEGRGTAVIVELPLATRAGG